MTREEIKQLLSGKLKMKLDPDTHVELDSMEVLSLCVELEEKHSIEVSFAEIQRCEKYQQLEDLIWSKK